MKFSDSFLDEVRARLPVSTVVSRRVPLKRAGREWKGLSPFNKEKTPSFTVNDQKQFYHCFSSGKHGDIFSFVMETEGLSFPEAVERLGAGAGGAAPEETGEARGRLAGGAGGARPKRTREDQEQEVRRNSLYDVMDLATEFFEASLKGRF